MSCMYIYNCHAGKLHLSRIYYLKAKILHCSYSDQILGLVTDHYAYKYTFQIWVCCLIGITNIVSIIFILIIIIIIFMWICNAILKHVQHRTSIKHFLTYQDLKFKYVGAIIMTVDKKPKIQSCCQDLNKQSSVCFSGFTCFQHQLVFQLNNVPQRVLVVGSVP